MFLLHAISHIIHLRERHCNSQDLGSQITSSWFYGLGSHYERSDILLRWRTLGNYVQADSRDYGVLYRGSTSEDLKKSVSIQCPFIFLVI